MAAGWIIPLLIGLVILGAAIGCALSAPRLHLVVRILVALIFAFLGMCCLWGFAAAMEPGDGHLVWRVGYVVLLVACLVAMGRLILAKPHRPHGTHGELPRLGA